MQNAYAAPATYVGRIEREGVAVTVEVHLDPSHAHNDMDETSEIASMAAVTVSQRVRESIARGQMTDPF